MEAITLRYQVIRGDSPESGSGAWDEKALSCRVRNGSRNGRGGKAALQVPR